MTNLFERTSSQWVRYSEYEWKAAADGTLYLTPTKAAQPGIYDPLAEYRQIVLDSIDIGRMGMAKKPDTEIQTAIRQFAVKYGLFGLMTALPTTPDFMEYEAVYLPKNHFIKAEMMSTEKYLELFFPFDKLDVIKHGIESMWNIENDRVMMALAMTMTDKPLLLEHLKNPRDGGDGQADGGQYELSAGVCGTIRLDEAAVHRLGVYLCQQYALL